MRKWQKLSAPKISIVICNFNYEHYVKSAIDSVIKQTLSAHEIIIVDDGSTDKSVEVIQHNFPDIKLIQKQNEGQISAYNSGFKHVTGDVVLFLDSDDELIPEALEEISQSFDENIVKVQFKMQITDRDGNLLDSILPSFLDSGNVGDSLLKEGVLYKSPPASGNSYRVSALKEIFPLPTSSEEKHGADYFCIYGSALLGHVASINKPLFRYRIHDSGSNIASSLGFGNAIKKHNRQLVAMRRWSMFKAWINDIFESKIILPELFVDFTQQKYFYAVDVLAATNYKSKKQVVKCHFKWLSKAIFNRKDFNFFKKIGLLVWMLLMLIAPGYIGIKLAKAVCNPVKNFQ